MAKLDLQVIELVHFLIKTIHSSKSPSLGEKTAQVTNPIFDQYASKPSPAHLPQSCWAAHPWSQLLHNQ